MIISFELFKTKRQKEKIAEENEKAIIEKLTKSILDGILLEDNYLISDKQALRTAYQMFNTAKEMGKIDNLNRIVG
jgi:hypothetical protein